MRDSVEARFLSLQRSRFSELVREKDKLKSFILELQQSVTRLYHSPSWEFFRQTGAWDRLQEYASAEDQFKFYQEWRELERVTLSGKEFGDRGGHCFSKLLERD